MRRRKFQRRWDDSIVHLLAWRSLRACCPNGEWTLGNDGATNMWWRWGRRVEDMGWRNHKSDFHAKTRIPVMEGERRGRIIDSQLGSGALQHHR